MSSLPVAVHTADQVRARRRSIVLAIHCSTPHRRRILSRRRRFCCALRVRGCCCCFAHDCHSFHAGCARRSHPPEPYSHKRPPEQDRLSHFHDEQAHAPACRAFCLEVLPVMIVEVSQLKHCMACSRQTTASTAQRAIPSSNARWNRAGSWICGAWPRSSNITSLL